jgi:hypothetical protein
MSKYPQVALTACQRDIWTAESRSPGRSQYSLAPWERPDGAVDRGLLHTWLARARRRRGAMHLRFDELDGAPCQWVDVPLAERIADTVALR